MGLVYPSSQMTHLSFNWITVVPSAPKRNEYAIDPNSLDRVDSKKKSVIKHKLIPLLVMRKTCIRMEEKEKKKGRRKEEERKKTQKLLI